PMQAHLAAVAAALLIAATAEPESLLWLGGLLAETETLRSELLLLPIAITLIVPMVAAAAGPLLAGMLERRGPTALPSVERTAAVATTLAVLALVPLCGLAGSVAAAFACGAAARQLA